MEFWGVEVKPGVPHKVKVSEDRLIHISQVALGETKKGNDNVVLFVNVSGKKLVMGTLSLDKCPQIQIDLVFEKDFELSHNSKNGSVYFSGYKGFPEGSDLPSDEDDSDDSESEDEIPLVANGKPEPLEVSKVGSSAKPKVKIVEPKKGDESEDDDSEDSSDEEESDEEDNTGASDGTNDDDDSDDDEEEEDESDDDTPDKAKQGNKRSAETSASKTPADKKAKLSTPQKSGADGKKGTAVHIATPHPAKKAGKKQETPKSAATPVSCNTCSKTFNSEKGLESHTKAKHSS